VENADPLRLEVAAAVEGVDEAPEIGAFQRSSHRVDREVPAEEIFADRGVFDCGQRCWSVVELGAGRDDVDAPAVAVEHDRSAELLVRPHPAVERVGERLSERDRVALDRDVDVEAALAEQDVAHRSTDEVDTLVRLADRGDCLEDGSEALETVELVCDRGRRPIGPLRPLAERPQQVAARHDADDFLTADDCDSVTARSE